LAPVAEPGEVVVVVLLVVTELPQPAAKPKPDSNIDKKTARTEKLLLIDQ
jgi:hypothetical protein